MPLVHTPAPEVHYAGDPAWLRVTAPVGPQRPAELLMNVLGSLSVGDELVFSWSGQTFTFTVSPSPSSSGFELPAQTSASLAEYTEELAAAFQACPALTFDFAVERSGAGFYDAIHFQARSRAIVDLAFEFTSSAVSIAVLSNPDPDLPPPHLRHRGAARRPAPRRDTACRGDR